MKSYQPVKENSPHSGLKARMTGQEFISSLPEVHAALLLADQVPDLLLVGPADLREGGDAARVTGFARRGSNEFAEAGENNKDRLM
jgi:hypothetical protein